MKKIKIFSGSFMGLMQSSISKMESSVNEFLARDGKEIKVLDVRHQGYQGMMSVMVTYEEL